MAISLGEYTTFSDKPISLALDGHVFFVYLMKHILVDLVLVGSNASKAMPYTTHMLMVYTSLYHP